jgi:hypothetical protein
VYEKSLEIRHFLVSLNPEEQKLPPFLCRWSRWAEERMKKPAPTEAAGSTIVGDQDAKTEILV